MGVYPLRDIPDDLWRQVRSRAILDGLKLRDAIVLGLRFYVAQGREALEQGARGVPTVPPSSRKRTRANEPIQTTTSQKHVDAIGVKGGKATVAR